MVGFDTKWSGRDQTCYFSAKGEPAFEPARRRLGQPDAAAEAARRGRQTALDDARATTRSLKHLPWDRDRDGYVYFHLSSPNLVVSDPMTRSGKTFKVRDFRPGVHRLPVSAIRKARGDNGLDVESATLAFVDEAFYPSFEEAFDWGKMAGSARRATYLDRAAEESAPASGTAPPRASGPVTPLTATAPGPST